MSEAAAIAALVATLAAAVARPRWAADWTVAVVAAGGLLAAGVLTAGDARDTVGELTPTVAFLAALLVLGEGCRRAGVFEAAGVAMASGARGRPRRLLRMVFAAAAGTTAVLGLDATAVLLTPVVLATAASLRTSARPHVYASVHLANSASLLLPVSNLTNLLALQASGLSFARFAALMALPWLIAVAVEWLVLSRAFAGELSRPARAAISPTERCAEPPRFALVVLAATLSGFALSSLLGVAPIWLAVAGALALAAHVRLTPRALVHAMRPTFLVFVVGLGLIVRAAGDHGLAPVVDGLIPHGSGPAALLVIAAASALLANFVNNLPATLIILPVVVAGGPGPVLAMLIGVNVGPNLSYVGSLATLLWRRVLRDHGTDADLRAFARLGALSVPPVLIGSTLALWWALQVI